MRHLIFLFFCTQVHAQYSAFIFPQSGAAAPTCTTNGYTHCRQITINPASTLVPSTQASFTVLIRPGTPIAGLAVTGSSGFIQHTVTFNGQTVPADLIFTSDNACTTLLSWEIAQYTSTTGNIEAWILIASLGTAAKNIYMCYGNAAITTYQGGAVGAAWDAATVAVWHLSDGTTLGSGTTVNDSSANTNTGTLVNTPTPVAGQIDGAAAFLQASLESIQIADNAVLHVTAVTISAWVNPTTLNPGGNTYNDVFQQNSTNPYEFMVKSTGKMAVYVHTTGGSFIFQDPGLTTVPLATWTHIAATYDSTNGLSVYVNGVLDQTAAAANGTMNAGVGLSFIGRNGGNNARDWNGKIDEVKVSNIARTSSWITTQFNNQSAPDTFSTIGAEQ